MIGFLFLELAEALAGRPQAVLLHGATEFSAQTYRKRKGLPRRPNARVRAQKTAMAFLRKEIVQSGVDADEADRLVAGQPDGLIQNYLYWLVYQDRPAHPFSPELARRYDLIDGRLSVLINAGDVEGLWKALCDRDLISDDLCRPLRAAGIPEWPAEQGQPDALAISVRLAHLYGHMVLSLLAVLDHELRPVVGTPEWEGRSLVALLIAPAAPHTKRMALQSPIALLVDLVAAIGIGSVQSQWPARRPTPTLVGDHMRRRRVGGSDPRRYIDSLRSGHAKLDIKSFRRLVGNVKPRPAGPRQTVDEEARMLAPMLVAAHLLTMVMPRLAGSHHHDRRGWREAYLEWWQAHATAQGLRCQPHLAPAPPAWLTFDQSSRSSQSAGRSSSPLDCQ